MNFLAGYIGLIGFGVLYANLVNWMIIVPGAAETFTVALATLLKCVYERRHQCLQN